MPGKVVHISEPAHIKMMEFCKEHDLHASEWVASLIKQAIIESKIPVEKKPIEKRSPPSPSIFSYITPASSEKSEDIFSRPPFWKGR